MSDSRRSGILIAFGVSAGVATWATACLVGVSQLFENAVWLYQTIKILGGCYLAYMGFRIILNSMKLDKNDPSQGLIPKSVSGISSF